MPAESRDQRGVEPRVKAAVLHSKRIAILHHLARKGPASQTGERELARELELSVHQVEYHLKVLLDADLIAVIEDESGPRRGRRSYVTVAANGR